MTAPAVEVELDPILKKRIERLANLRHRSTDSMMREAIRQYVEREEQRESFRQDAKEAWKEYRETGMHVTGDEVAGWLETWGDENEKPAPECHK